jgi:hypothetical protein
MMFLAGVVVGAVLATAGWFVLLADRGELVD